MKVNKKVNLTKMFKLMMRMKWMNRMKTKIKMMNDLFLNFLY